MDAALAELAAPLPVAGATSRAAGVPRDRRGGGVAGTLAALVASGEPVLVACADARRRRGHLEGRLGGFAVAAWHALERDPALVGALRARRSRSTRPRPTPRPRWSTSASRWPGATPRPGTRCAAHEAGIRPAPGGRRGLPRPARRRAPRRGRRRALACRRGPRPARARRARASSASTGRGGAGARPPHRARRLGGLPRVHDAPGRGRARLRRRRAAPRPDGAARSRALRGVGA